ncbi:alpha/beta hydrolase family protein [Ruminococcus flavefaciens]|uniref:alpha/beta hydrolase family protein n=1 Tax=Ruminococcus flavefaciens TaxID=1265 RepID=UPI003F059E18
MSKNGKKSKKRAILIFIALFIIISIVVGYVITCVEMNKNFGRGDYPEKRFAATYFYDHYENDYPRQEVSFLSGENTLKGYIYGGSNDKGLIVFAHGIGGGHEYYLKLLTKLVDDGWRIFAYDATGSGNSAGEGSKGLAQSVIDLDLALDFAESDPELGKMDTYVLGHSWGGYAAAAVLNFDHDIKGCITMSGYNTPYEQLASSCDSMYGKAGILLHPFVWTYNKMKFGKDSSWSAVDGINKADIPVLVIHGNEDETIGYEEAAVIAHKDEITNPDAEYKVFTEEGRNGHNSYFYTPEYRDYNNNVLSPKSEALKEKYGKDIPDEEMEKYYASVDKELYNGFNQELIDLIDDFFTKCMG